MKKILFLIFIFYFGQSKQILADDYIVAKVNNKAITKSELDDRYKFVLFIAKLNIKNKEEKAILINQIMDKMIDEELIRQHAKSLNMEVSAGQIRDVIDDIAKSQKKNATQLKLSIINKGLSFNNYLNQVESEILWSQIISQVLRSKIKVTDVEINEFFEQQKFDTNVTRFNLAEIFIPKSENAKKLAEKLVVELKNGADFKNVVKQFSSSFSVENDGVLGWVSHNEIDPKIYNAIKVLKINGYSQPVLLADGYFIFKILDRRIETKIAEQDLLAAKNIIFSKKLQTYSKGYLMDLRKDAFVEKSKGI